MTTKEFWYDDEELMDVYLIAYQNKLNMTGWINGARMFEAVSLTVYNAFKSKNSSVQTFSDAPARIEMDVSNICENTQETPKTEIEKSIEKDRIKRSFSNRWI